ncbi:MAG: hypothetical protein AB9880_02575 [Christensenellales bacterium]
MTSFADIVEKYREKQKSCLVDTLAAGLSLGDELSFDLGLLGDTGVLGEALNVLSLGLPLTLIALSEGSKVLLKRKTQTAGLQDAAFRMFRTGAAMGAGAIVSGLGAGALPAIPVAMGVRAALQSYRSKALTSQRVRQRTKRLRALRAESFQADAPRQIAITG